MISLQRRSPNAALIGLAKGRDRLMTPCLVVDRLALRRNIERMAALCREAGVALRPHAKTHKSVEIARMQVEAGAVGIAVASVGEAEVMVEGGISDVLITSVIVTPAKFARVAALARAGAKISVVFDDIAAARAFDEALVKDGIRIGAYIDVDMGRHRSGVPNAEKALELAEFLRQSASFDLHGLQAYAGHVAHVADFSQRVAEADAADRNLNAVKATLSENGITIDRISGASTGSVLVDLARKRYNELQCGSYVFMDVEYNAVALDPEQKLTFESSLFVYATAISSIVPGRVTVDAGHKHFAGTALPRVVAGAPAGAEMRPHSDEHGILSFPPDGEGVAIGTLVACIPPHCDPTVNLYSHFHIVEHDQLVAVWPVDARGEF